MPKRKRRSAEFKFKVALEAARGTKTLSELSSEYEVHPSQISEWKSQLLKDGASIFSTNTARQRRDQETLQTELYEQIGRLKMELEWLKKKLPNDIQAKCAMIEPGHPHLSLRRQCELVGLNRSTFYYRPAGESDLNLHLMRLIDKQYTKTPFYGWPRMTAQLRRHGYAINHKRVQRLMSTMGLQAIHPRPRTSMAAKGHKVYPYLLRRRMITRPNQVWSTDITYIPILRGFMYLVAVIDWYSRYLLAWQLSNTLDERFCLDALERALAQGQPDIFNTALPVGNAPLLASCFDRAVGVIVLWVVRPSLPVDLTLEDTDFGLPILQFSAELNQQRLAFTDDGNR